jgi:hypothetical protein
MNDAAFLREYFEKLDSKGLDVLPLLAPNFTFSVQWSTDEGAREFAGGLDEFHGYLAQREPDGQLHHIDVGIRDGRREVVLGHTTRHGERLATFTFAAWLDDEGRAERLYAARTLSFGTANGL